MLRVVYANSLELLTAVLSEAMPHGDPFATTEVVVSHPVVGRWLQLALARQHGGVAGVTTSLLDKYALQTAMAQASLALAPLSRTSLTSLIASELAEDHALAAALRVVGTERAAVRRRVEMSERLAALLLEYARTRPAWLDAWGDGALDVGLDPRAAHLAWQPRLYRAILRRAQRGLAARGSDALPVMAPRALRAMAKRHKDIVVATSPLHVLGFSYLAPSDLETLKIIAAHRPVVLYQLNPSADYWMDTPRRTGAFARQRAFAADEAAGASLRLWATPVRDTVAWLLEHADEIDGVFARPTAEASNLLLRWQERILAPSEAAAREAVALDVAASPAPDAPEAELDGSVRLHACPSPMRELEVAVDALLARVAADASPSLPSAALLIAGAGAETYLALVPLVLASRGRVPHAVADALHAERATLAHGLAAMLRLAQYPVTKTSLLAVLTHEGLGLARAAQRESWRSMAERLDIFWGADDAEVEATYLHGSGAGHWDQGLSRLALGAFMSGATQGDWRAARVGTASLLPADWVQGDLDGAAALLHAARRVLADRHALAGASQSLAAWCEAVARLAEAYRLSAAQAQEEQAATHAVDDYAALARALAALREADFDGRAVGVGEFLLRFTAVALAPAAGHHGTQLLCDGLYVGLVSTMRPLPFRYVAVVGLGDHQFPTPPQPDAMDLRVQPARGDVSPQARDRQAFFDVLLATRRGIDLCYAGNDASDGTPLAPSPVLAELARTLRPEASVEEALAALTTRHPLYAWDDAEAHASPTMVQARTFPANASQLPALAQLAQAPGASPWCDVFGMPPRLVRQAQVPKRLAISSLRKFLERPADGWAKVALGAHEVAEAPEDDLAADTEAFAASKLDLALVVRETLVRCLRTGASAPAMIASALDEAIAHRQGEGQWPLAQLGVRQAQRCQAMLAQWLALPALAERQAIWRWRFGMAEPIEELRPARLIVPVAVAGELHQVEVIGVSECVGAAAGLIAINTNDDARDMRAWLRLGLDRVLVAAAGLGEELPHAGATLLLTPKPGALDDGKTRWHAAGTLPVWSQPAAQAYVSALIAELVGAPHAYRLDLKQLTKPLGEPPPRGGAYLDDRAFGAPPELAAILARRYRPLLTSEQWAICTKQVRAPRAKPAAAAPRTGAVKSPRSKKVARDVGE